MTKANRQSKRPSMRKSLSDKVKRAKFIAETDTRRRASAPVKAEIEQRLIKGILAQSLALHILRNSEIPASDLSQELTDIEFQSGKFLGATFKLMGRNSSIDLTGVLKGVFSFIPLNTELVPKAARPFLEAFKERTVKFLLGQLDGKGLEKADSSESINFEKILEGVQSDRLDANLKPSAKEKNRVTPAKSKYVGRSRRRSRVKMRR